MSVHYSQLIVRGSVLNIHGLRQQEFKLLSDVFPSFSSTTLSVSNTVLVPCGWDTPHRRSTNDPELVDYVVAVLNRLAEIGYRVISVNTKEGGVTFYTLEMKQVSY